MIFTVGPWTYRTRIVHRLMDDTGDKKAGLFEWMTRTIWIAADVPADRRLAVLIHELRHAWQFDFGRPKSDEDDANQAASFCIDVMRQLADQGGEAALMQMRPENDPATPGRKRRRQTSPRPARKLATAAA